MTLEATMDVIAIVICLLVVILGYMVSTFQEFRILRRIERRLDLLEKSHSEYRNANDANSKKPDG